MIEVAASTAPLAQHRTAGLLLISRFEHMKFGRAKPAPGRSPHPGEAAFLVARGRNYTWTTAFTVPIEVRVA